MNKFVKSTFGLVQAQKSLRQQRAALEPFHDFLINGHIKTIFQSHGEF